MSQRVFGYGSLVNANTHPKNARATGLVTLNGWRRAWAHRMTLAGSSMCVLTIEPSAGTVVVGVVLHCDAAAKKALDRREVGYEQHDVEVTDSGSPSRPISCIAYVGTTTHREPAKRVAPIWRSYLDCVLAGFFAMGGAAALEDFITSTGSWDGPILDDRDDPNYSRAVSLSTIEARVIDEALAKHGLLANLVPDA